MSLLKLTLKTVSLGSFQKLCCQRQNCYVTKSILGVIADIETKRSKNSPATVAGVALIKKYSESVPWDLVSESLAKYDKNVQNLIINCCSRLQGADILIDYLKYIYNKGERLSPINLFVTIKSLSDCPPSEILKHTDSIIDLYHHCKDVLVGSQLYQQQGCLVFSYIPECYRDLLPYAMEDPQFHRKEIFAARAFDFDQESVAWEILEKWNLQLHQELVKSFINFCIRKAIQNKFSVELIQKMIDLSRRKGYIFQVKDISCYLQPLISVLNHVQDNYVWSARATSVNPQLECLNCDTFLKDTSLSQEEFQTLKQVVHDTLVPKDVFLKSTNQEFVNFKVFLSRCKTYDLVVDGMNFLYRGILPGKSKMAPIILEKFVKHKNLSVLIILREHFKNINVFKFPNIQKFYTQNTSDDDLFVIFAALHGGLGTKFLSCDFLASHSSKLSPEHRLLFIKWQLCHQYIIDPKFGVVLPNLHAGLSQCTESPETGGESYKWHLSYQTNSSLYSFRTDFDWLCFQAKPRDKLKEKTERSRS